MQRIMFENTFRFVLPPFPLLLHLLSLACTRTHGRTKKIACTMQLNLLPIFFYYSTTITWKGYDFITQNGGTGGLACVIINDARDY